jgi:hypothetical protein
MAELVSVAAPDYATFAKACAARDIGGPGQVPARWLSRVADLESAAGLVWLADRAGPFEEGFLSALWQCADRGDITVQRV